MTEEQMRGNGATAYLKAQTDIPVTDLAIVQKECLVLACLGGG